MPQPSYNVHPAAHLEANANLKTSYDTACMRVAGSKVSSSKQFTGASTLVYYCTIPS